MINSLFHKMRRYGAKRKLPYGIYQVAKSAAKEAAFLNKQAKIAEAQSLLTGGQPVALGNVRTKREEAKLRGNGMYTGMGGYNFGKSLKRFARGGIARDMKDQVRRIIRGEGMYTGVGDYACDTNDLIHSSKSTMDVVPLFYDETDTGILYSKREYVSEIYGPPLVGGQPQPFVLQSFAINPGLEATFPWLSQIAANFDEYEMQQLIFTFKSTTTESGNQVNGQVGTVIMVTNYNSAAPNFTDKFTMMQYAGAKATRLTESLQAGVECDPEKLSGSAGEYVRTNPVVTGQDLKTYDHGKFQIAIANCTSNLANQSLGELWVTYTVRLRKPKFFTGKGLAISKDIFLSYPSGSEVALAPFGTSPLKGQQNNIGVLLGYGASNNIFTLTFPAAVAGDFRVLVALDSASVATISQPAPFYVTSGNVNLTSDFYGPGTVLSDAPQNQIFSQVTGNVASVPVTTGWIGECHVRINIATNGVDNILSVCIPTTGGTAQLYMEISEYNAGFSYAANNLGSSTAPIWVTSQGVVTLP